MVRVENVTSSQFNITIHAHAVDEYVGYMAFSLGPTQKESDQVMFVCTALTAYIRYARLNDSVIVDEKMNYTGK